MRYNADISPAIRELKKLHLSLLDEANARLGSEVHAAGWRDARDTVISVVPAERRRELGWYKWRMWEKKSDTLLKGLDPSYQSSKYHEIFIAGEALSGKPSELVLLMMHQVAHQAASIPSTQSYHGEWLKYWMERLFGVSQEAFTRQEILGWVDIDQSKMGDEAKKMVAKLAKRIKPENIDLFRDKLKKHETTGKMYLWYCECVRAPRLRTGAIPQLVCQKCMQPVKFRDASKVSADFLARVPEEYRG